MADRHGNPARFDVVKRASLALEDRLAAAGVPPCIFVAFLIIETDWYQEVLHKKNIAHDRNLAERGLLIG